MAPSVSSKLRDRLSSCPLLEESKITIHIVDYWNSSTVPYYIWEQHSPFILYDGDDDYDGWMIDDDILYTYIH